MQYYYGLPSDVWRYILSLSNSQVRFQMRLTGRYFRDLSPRRRPSRFILMTPSEPIGQSDARLNDMYTRILTWIEEQTKVTILDLENRGDESVLDRGTTYRSRDGIYTRVSGIGVSTLFRLYQWDNEIQIYPLGSYHAIKDRFITYYNVNNQFGMIWDCYELIVELSIIDTECIDDDEWCTRTTMFNIILACQKRGITPLYRLDRSKHEFHVIIPLQIYV